MAQIFKIHNFGAFWWISAILVSLELGRAPTDGIWPNPTIWIIFVVLSGTKQTPKTNNNRISKNTPETRVFERKRFLDSLQWSARSASHIETWNFIIFEIIQTQLKNKA